MTPDELNAIEARAEAATKGPWVKCAHGQERGGSAPTWWSVNRGQQTPQCLMASARQVCRTMSTISDADAAFIAHAREDIPALVAEVRKLQEELDAATGALSKDELIREAIAGGQRDGIEKCAAWHEARARLRRNRADTSVGLADYGNWVNMANDDERDARSLRALKEEK